MVERMKANLKKIKRGKVFSAIISLVMGAIMIGWPMTSLEVIVRMLAVALIVVALYAILMFLVNGGERSVPSLIGGIVLGVIGSGLFYRPDLVVNYVPIIVGVLVVLSGLSYILESITLARIGYRYWYVSLILGLLTIVLGLLLIFYPFQAAQVVTRIIGVIIIFSAISSLWIIAKISSNIRTAESLLRQAQEDMRALDPMGEYMEEATTPQSAPVQNSVEQSSAEQISTEQDSAE